MELLDRVPATGRLEWIGVSPERRAAQETPTEVRADPGSGLVGDHHGGGSEGKREVTLVQAEHLPVIAALCGRERVAPQDLRRNLVVAEVNLYSLKDRRFRIGEVLLEGTGACPPCSRIEESLGEGGYQATRGHGGITARVIEGGVLRLGDVVQVT